MSKAYGFSGAPKRRTMTTADFRAMADFLSLRSNVFMPSFMYAFLKRAIHKTHLYFIDELEKVQRTFSSVSTPTAPKTPVSPDVQAVNRFAGLTLQETTEDDRNVDEPVTTEPGVFTKHVQDDVVFEPWKDDLEEALFQWRLFNMDVQRIRNQITQLWGLYRADELDLASVATAHNMAIHVVRNLEQDFQPVFDKHVGYRNMGTVPGAESRSFIDGFDIAEEEMLFAWQALGSEVVAWNTCGGVHTYEGKWGPFVPSDDRQNMSNRERYNQDKVTACKAVVDIQILAIFLNRRVGMKLDGLSIAIEELVPWSFEDAFKHEGMIFPTRETNITFRMVFATQLLLDSVHALGRIVARPGRELRDISARIFKSCKGTRDFYKSAAGSVALGQLPGPSFADEVERSAQFWRDPDPVAKFRLQVQGLTADSSNMPPEGEDYTVLTHNLPLSGWWLHCLRANFYAHGMTMANSLILPKSCARLYFASTEEGLLPKGSWPDMEAFSILHRGDLWLGEAPRRGQYLKSLMLAAGGSTVGSARDARYTRRSAIRKDAKANLSYGAPVSTKIFDAFALRDVEGISENELEQLMAETKLRWYGGKAVRPCFHHGWAKAGDYQSHKNSAASSKTDNPFLRLAQALDAEALEQTFDYISLNRVCWMVLQELFKKGRPIIEAACGKDLKPVWDGVEGVKAHKVVFYTFFALFPQDGTVRREASEIAEILLGMTKGFGRVVHTSTGKDWAHELRCTCADISA
ncbi:Uu.00g053880.m01.CDS01 [Anthostomella pinea]|uniref:Uu.00g053880.m01.CDS01 n=1 Tax=Anthostomella pinea TaxID=933095 RepID=A0AAI8VXR3_9PEZI|nr:Uu.00g053880.m01.CDS01 [Anthostomella pinea]